MSYYQRFGAYDMVLPSEARDNLGVASIITAAAGPGAVTNLRTTVLMSIAEGQQAIQPTQDVADRPTSYRPITRRHQDRRSPPSSRGGGSSRST